MYMIRRLPVIRLGLAALASAILAGCGGGNDGGAPVVGGGGAVGGAAGVSVNTAAVVSTATNPNNAFTALSGSPVVINSPPKVRFVVWDNGAPVTGLTTSNARFILAKLVPGANGEPDQWQSYSYTMKTGAAGIGPNGGAPVTVRQATTDGSTTNETTGCATAKNPDAGKLIYDTAGKYYTYHFCKDITSDSDVTYEAGKVHRIAIQLSYTDHNGQTVRVNPYYDFTVDSSGNSVAATGRKMADVNNCNTCHNTLALHGGGRIDTQFCVMCHNPGTVDPESGNNLDLKTMVHKIHSGRRLHAAGEDYIIWGYNNNEHDYSHVGFPQDLRNCSKCHSASESTPQGDNWKTKPSKEACLTCHKSDATSPWFTAHVTNFNGTLGSSAAQFSNTSCQGCHLPTSGTNLHAERVHWNQNEERAAEYKVNITEATYDSGTRAITVKYNVTNSAGTKYDLAADSGCVNSNSRFYNLLLRPAYQTMIGWSASNPTDFSNYNNGVSSPTARMCTGTNDGSNNYTAVITLPADTATSMATGTARVLSYGQVKEEELNVATRTGKGSIINVSAQNTYKDVALSGSLSPRRMIVSNAKCNLCHGLLGTSSGSNTLSNAFHSGARNTVESCALCHDANRMSSSTVMQDGSGYNESYHFKRMIHGIHGGAKRTNDFYHGTDNLTAEVAYPGILSDCTTCHENNSYQSDRGVLGSVISKKDPDPLTGAATTDPGLWKVISPKAASCTACHDSDTVKTHVITTGGAAYGYRFSGFNVVPATQANMLSGAVAETCDGCHAPGAYKGVDIVHQVPHQNVN